MEESLLLETIRPFWINRCVQRMARGTGVREDFRSQLERLFALLVQVVETGDPSWLDAVLNEWANAQTQTDLQGAPSNLTRFLKESMLITSEVCREVLPESQALHLISTLLPAFAYAFDRAAEFEMQVKITYLSSQLSQVQQTLEKLDRSKSDFISVAAHELKTPLTLVEGYTAMLRESLSHLPADSGQRQLIEGILTGTHRLKDIIDDMIDVSLIDNNLLALNFQPFWVNRLLKVLRLEMEDALAERRQTLKIDEFPGSGEVNFGDPERLLQVFRNILLNAIKFTPDGGKILVGGRKLPGFIEVTVRDTGIGIDPENQDTIFEKFARLGNISLHSTGKIKYKGGGPGLGLHIARGIVEAHGGAIWVESPGCDEDNHPGSTFHVLLPAREAPPDDRSAKLFAPLVQNSQAEESRTKPNELE